MYTDNFTVHVKSEGIYEDFARDVETGFNTSDYEIKRALPIGKNKKVIRLVKDELRGKITKIPKMYSYLTDESLVNKNKGRKKCVMRRETKF